MYDSELKLDHDSIHAVDDIFFITDVNGIIKYYSKCIDMKHIFNISILKGDNLFDILSDIGISSQIIYEHISNNYTSALVLQTNIPYIDGTLYPCTLTFSLMDNGGDDAEIVVHLKDNREMTSYIQEQRKLKMAIEHSPASIIITDTKGNIEYANYTFYELTGYTKDEVIGKNPRFLHSGRHSLDFYKDLWNTILSGNTWVGEFLNKTKNGKLFWESAQISPLRNSNGDTINFVAIKQDITDLKMAQIELKKQRNELSDFAHNVAHDIRNPLTIICTYAQMLDQEYDSDKIKKIINKTKELDNFIKNSLLLADAGKIIGEKKSIDLNKLVYAIADEVIPEQIEYYQDILPCIVGDDICIKQIFQNILSNAVFHGNPSLIRVRSKVINDVLHIFISNNGDPICPDIREKIFDRGFTTKKGSTGLGLNIVKKLVNSSGGEICLSCTDKDTIFEITLPLTRQL